MSHVQDTEEAHNAPVVLNPEIPDSFGLTKLNQNRLSACTPKVFVDMCSTLAHT
jgi:hypothetical protein